MRRFAIILSVLFIACAFFFPYSVESVSGKFWTQKEYKDFDDGTPKMAAAGSDGKIRLAPVYKSIYKIKEKPHIWSSIVDSTGNIIVGTGTKAGVYKIAPSGQEMWKVSLEGLQVTALAKDRRNNIYAAVSPDGIIYKISSKGKYEKYFSCREKYVWALVIGRKGNLFAATGTKGRIYKITDKDEGEVFARIEDTQITTLATGKDGKIYGGTDSKGYVFSVDENGKIFILYDATEKEIKSILIDGDNIYFAAVNDSPKPLPMKVKKTKEKKDTKSADTTISILASLSGAKPDIPFPKLLRAGHKSALYRIDKDNRVELLFKTSKTTMFSLAKGMKDGILISGGEKGRVYSFNEPNEFALLMEVENKQLTTMSTFEKTTFVCSSNEAEIYRMDAKFPKEGYFYSGVFDTGSISKWGIVKWGESLPPETNIRFYTRTGNTAKPDNTWSDWSSPYLVSDGAKIASVSARFIQWKVMLKTLNAGRTPLVDFVSLSYLPLNLKPSVKTIKLYPKGVALKERRDFSESDPRLKNALENGESKKMPKISLLSRSSSKKYFAEGALSITWKATDGNGDKLLYNIYYKAKKETTWKLLAEDYKRTFYTWDTKAVADGYYNLKIIADDSPSTPGQYVLKGEKVSGTIIVDNTPPKISKPTYIKKANSIAVSFAAVDNLNPVSRCRYSVNGGKWKIVFPKDGIGDTLKEEYFFEVKVKNKGEQTIVVQVEDLDGNIATESISLRM